MTKRYEQTIIDLAVITFGCLLYGFGLVTVNMANQLAEGGMTGVTLLLKYTAGLDPAYTTLLLNIPLIIIGYRYLGKRGLFYTLYGTAGLSVSLWIFQRVPVTLDIHHDLVIAALLAGLFGGVGSGLIYRRGGTTGGADVIARILEKRRGIPMGKTLLLVDIVVLTVSLTYLSLELMVYTLIASYVFSRIVDFTLEGAYAAKGAFVITSRAEKVAQQIMLELERGVTYLNAEGAFARDQKKMVYVVLAPNEIADLKRIIDETDPRAFISIVDVHEALGEGFTYQRKPRRRLL